jgi:hypothetical protein
MNFSTLETIVKIAGKFNTFQLSPNYSATASHVTSSYPIHWSGDGEGPVKTNSTSLVNVLLQGGPEDLGPADRRRRVPAGEPVVKVLRAHCTEHFRKTPQTIHIEQLEFQVYQWFYRTYVAE